MLEAPALSARRVGALIDPSGAPTATEPGACSSPRPPGVPRVCCRQCRRARPARLLPTPALLSPRVHHITASRTTTAHTHLHLHRTPPHAHVTRSPLPLHRPCPSSHVSRACAQPSQDKTFLPPTAVCETTPGSSYQLHEDNNTSVAAGQGATHDEPLAVRAITALLECRQKAASSLQVLLADACGHHVMIAPASTLCVACLRHAAVLSE
jgi:hypothetical protein